MTAIDDTAYPTLTKIQKAHSLVEASRLFIPTDKEKYWVNKSGRSREHREGLMIQLKLFQKLGYFINYNDIPKLFLDALIQADILRIGRRELKAYFTAKTAARHQQMILKHVNVRPWTEEACKQILINWLIAEAHTKERTEDLVNVALEYLVNIKTEFPPFKSLLRHCHSAKVIANKRLFQQVSKRLSLSQEKMIEQLFVRDKNSKETGWSLLRKEPGKSKPEEIERFLVKMNQLTSHVKHLPAINDIPNTKSEQLYYEARAMDAANMKSIQRDKRLTLAVIFMHHVYATSLDDFVNIFIKLTKNLINLANRNFDQYHLDQRKETTKLIKQFQSMLEVFRADNNEAKLS